MENIIAKNLPSYFASLRKFNGNRLEMLLRVISPSSQERMAAVRDGLPLAPPLYMPRELSDIERAMKDMDNWARSVRRAKQSVRWLCLQMQADRLLTLTYRANVEDREIVKSDFQRFLELLKRGGFKYRDVNGEIRRAAPLEDFRYVAVLERQDRGAYHVHMAVKGFQRVSVIRAAWYKACSDADGNRVGDSLVQGEDTPGAVNITSPRDAGKGRREWKCNQLAGYITKYLAKTFDESQVEKKRYWHSMQVKKPEKQLVWLVSTNMGDAIRELWQFSTDVHDMMGNSAVQWVNPSGTVYWLSVSSGGGGCPF